MENAFLRSVAKIRLMKEEKEFTFMDIMDTELFKISDVAEQKRQASMFSKLVTYCGNEIGISKKNDDFDSRNSLYKKRLYVNNKLQDNSPMWDKNNKEILLKALENLSTFKKSDNFRVVDLIEFSMWCDLEDIRIEWLNKALDKIFTCGVVGIRLHTMSNELDIKVYTIV